MTMPVIITRRGPKRSIAQPSIGPSRPLSTRCSANANAKAVRFHPKSSWSSTTYAPNAWKTSPPLTVLMRNPAVTIHQP